MYLCYIDESGDAGQLATVIFKQLPDHVLLNQLKANGYHLTSIPKNPYSKQ